MGTTLTGTTPQDTYDSLIKVTDNGPLSGTAKYLSDGLGNDSALAMSTTAVGVGTSSLFADLQVNKASDVTLALSNSTAVTSGNRGNLVFYNSAVSTVALIKATAVTDNVGTQLEFYTRPAAGSLAQTMTIASTGNVGIGTSAPDKKLQVAGPVGVASTTSVLNSSNTGIYASTGGNTSNYNGIFFQGVSSKDMYFGRKGEAGVDDLVVSTAEASPVEIARFRRDGGLTFNGDTAAANALDDYEEGTFTPTVIGSTTAGTADYVRAARYTKIGRQVSVQIDISWTSGTGTGSLQILGLPFAESQGATNPAVTIGFIQDIALTADHYALAYIANTGTRIDLVQYPVGGSTLASVAYSASGRLILNATYLA